MITFKNLFPDLKEGVAEYIKFHKIENLSLSVEIEESKDNTLKIEKSGNAVKLSLPRPFTLFRALTIVRCHLDEDVFTYSEKLIFDMGCPMFDGSQASSLMNLDTLKKMTVILASMGFNSMMLYMEDCYEIEGEPYFGNMRPRYKKAELKEIDRYAASFGIEVIPCIQALAHMTEALKRKPYKSIADRENIMSPAEDATYALIEKMLQTTRECFKSDRIHIGMDEAWGLGTGGYLKKMGYVPATEIMAEHLKKVSALCRKYSYKPMMWCDMFFRAKSKTDDYFDEAVTFTDEDRAFVPDGMALCYWDYYKTDSVHYEKYIDKLSVISDNIIFAGCARNVRTFGNHFDFGKATTDAAMEALKKKGIREFLATVWGDDHRESSTFAVLTQLQLFAEHMYSESTPDFDMAKLHFCASVNASWDAFSDIDALDSVPGYTEGKNSPMPISKMIMWQNVLMGLFDFDLKGKNFYAHYNALKDKFLDSSEKYPEYAHIFKFYYNVANVLKNKAEIGLKLKDAYDAKDKEKLSSLLCTLKELYDDMTALRLAHRDYFYTEYKPIGWEVLDIRYGGAIMGIDTAIKRVTDYLEGKTDSIEELSEERLPDWLINYKNISTASGISTGV